MSLIRYWHTLRTLPATLTLNFLYQCSCSLYVYIYWWAFTLKLLVDLGSIVGDGSQCYASIVIDVVFLNIRLYCPRYYCSCSPICALQLNNIYCRCPTCKTAWTLTPISGCWPPFEQVSYLYIWTFNLLVLTLMQALMWLIKHSFSLDASFVKLWNNL